jgi:hypothetical protein
VGDTADIFMAQEMLACGDTDNGVGNKVQILVRRIGIVLGIVLLAVGG